ncbi:pyridoxine/pyridoxamine 5'-phosphate oxidase [Filimonas sp.]|nr:pyridoxine/pyridoxamine 5'-phosphate oxidase [Filimonas sp.]
MGLSNQHIAGIRQEYALASLLESDTYADPIQQFQKWFQESVESEIEDVNAMTLSTSDESGRPHARIVLLKGIEQNRFVFFTNYQSHKGKEMEMNPHVSLVFHWKELQRQVRIEGVVSKISEEESSLYFHSRPKDSQISAWASHQSEVLGSREELEVRFNDLKEKYNDIEVPKPPHWGGFAVEPTMIEFWQGRSNRLHDRLCYYAQTNVTWIMKRLNP